MRLKTILNECTDFQSFVIGDSYFNPSNKSHIEVQLRPRKNSRPICSICGVRSSCYDHLPERQFQFIPFWGFQVFLLYSMRRVNCQACGIKVEQVPWADGKHTLTHEYAKYLSDWAKDLFWTVVAKGFRTSWQTVYRSIFMIIAYGLANRSIEGIEVLGG